MNNQNIATKIEALIAQANIEAATARKICAALDGRFDAAHALTSILARSNDLAGEFWQGTPDLPKSGALADIRRILGITPRIDGRAWVCEHDSVVAAIIWQAVEDLCDTADQAVSLICA